MLKDQSIRNVVWLTLNALLYPALLIIFTPYFISSLGSDQYGIWIFINSIVQLISVLNFGLGESLVKFISEDSAAIIRINKLVSTALTTSISIAMIFGVTAVAISQFITIEMVSQITNLSYETVLLILRLSIIFILFKFLDQIILSIYQGFGRYDQASGLQILSRAVLILANFFILIFGYGIIEVLVSSVVTQLFFLVIDFILLGSLHKQIKFRLTIEINTLKQIMTFGVWSWLQSMLAISASQIDRILVGTLSGAAALSYYSIGSLVVMQIHSIIYSSSSWLFAKVSNKSAQNEPLISYYKNAQSIIVISGYIIIIAIMLSKSIIIKYWLGFEVYDKSDRYIEVFLYYYAFLVLNIVPYFFLNGSGNIKVNTAIEFSMKIANIVCIVIASLFFGTEAIIWGLLFSTALFTPIRLYYVSKSLSVKNEISFSEIKLGFLPSIFLILAFESDIFFIKATCVVVFLILIYWLLIRQLDFNVLRVKFSKL